MDEPTDFNEPLTILIVDDEPDIREFISYFLSHKGYRVFAASNGREAVDIAKRVIPDLVILDILMPEMNGYETCRVLRSTPGLEMTRILFLSALSESYVGEISDKLNADGFISKPIRMGMLVKKVEERIRRTG
ncbi:MAG TPA: response regulator [Bacteroidia bacterium]|nr:response regulator [Bacteroidia bacterium]